MTKPAPGPDLPPIPVRLVTFNTHHGAGEDDRFDLARVVELLRSMDADVICLQEVDRYFGERSEDVDEALLLSRALGMQLAWGPAIEEPRPEGPDRQYGLALLSRLPILVSDVHRLPGSGEPRIALRTMVELDGAPLWVTNTHLTNRPVEQVAQVATLTELVTEPMETGVLAGDFNAVPDAPELAPLRARFRDAWAAADEREGGSGATHPARAPRRRIDQVWVSPGIAVRRARVPDPHGASDHRPVMVDLAVPSGV